MLLLNVKKHQPVADPSSMFWTVASARTSPSEKRETLYSTAHYNTLCYNGDSLIMQFGCGSQLYLLKY